MPCSAILIGSSNLSIAAFALAWPILNNLLFEVKKGSLKIFATNLEVGVRVNIGAKVESDGKLTIPAKIIGNFINNLSGEENIILESINQNLKIKSGPFKAIIKGISAEEFPLIPNKMTKSQLKLPVSEIKKIFEKIMSSVAINETRPELTGVNIIFNEKELFFASTDSFRLTECRIFLKEGYYEKNEYQKLIEKRNNIIVPANTFMELNRIMSSIEDGDIEIAIEEGQIFFNLENLELVSRLINGKYPEYKHIMPKKYQTRAVGSKNMLQSAVKMASIFSAGKTGEIGIKISQEDKKIFIEGKSAETGENVSELNFEIQGPSVEAILNAKYILDGINSAKTHQIAILMNNSTTPLAIKEIDDKNGKVLEDFVHILMPIKK